MLKVVKNKIYLTKCDDGTLPVNLSAGESEYVMGDGEFLTLSVRKLPCQESPLLLQAKSNPGSSDIFISKAASAEMIPGVYSADIQFTDANGRDYTIWPDVESIGSSKDKCFGNFILVPEVS